MVANSLSTHDLKGRLYNPVIESGQAGKSLEQQLLMLATKDLLTLTFTVNICSTSMKPSWGISQRGHTWCLGQ